MTYTLLALLAVFLTAGALLASGISAWVYRSLKCAWPMLVFTGIYAASWLLKSPPPVEAAHAGAALSFGEFLRYSSFAAALLWWHRDYMHALKSIQRLTVQLQEATRATR